MSNTPSLYTAPVGFSQPMMAANLAGRKFQTRRLPSASGVGPWGRLLYAFEVQKRPCVLWVKERVDRGTVERDGEVFGHYTIDNAPVLNEHGGHAVWPFKTSFVTHLPRRWSRFVCVVKGVRYEPLQDISADDAKAEGLGSITKDGRLVKYGIPDLDGYPGTDNHGWPWDQWEADSVKAYRKLWDSLHGKPGQRWYDNPMVWVIDYEWKARHVDDLLKEVT